VHGQRAYDTYDPQECASAIRAMDHFADAMNARLEELLAAEEAAASRR
jgi:hypothetical protein